MVSEAQIPPQALLSNYGVFFYYNTSYWGYIRVRYWGYNRVILPVLKKNIKTSKSTVKAEHEPHAYNLQTRNLPPANLTKSRTQSPKLYAHKLAGLIPVNRRPPNLNICIYIYMYVDMCIHIYIYIYINWHGSPKPAHKNPNWQPQTTARNCQLWLTRGSRE